MKNLHLLVVIAGCACGTLTASAETLFGLDQSNRIFRFDSAAPGAITFLNSGSPIAGLATNEILVGIDFRPVATTSANASLNGALYAVGLSNRLYTIKTDSGQATQVGAAGGFMLSGNAFGVDFNPVPDLLRVVSELDQNIRLFPNTGALAGTDTPLAYATGDSGLG